MTMADRFLLFQIDGKSGSGQKLLEGVTVSLTGKTSGNDYLITAQLIYPKTSAKWESYESYWMRSNRLQLVPTGQKTPLQADNFQIGDDNITYLFRGGAKVLSQGWNATYQTPATMREVAIPFELSGVPLPK
ncbi:MAG: hypothetical protein R3B84_06435 [Zavarzinella sp.]